MSRLDDIIDYADEFGSIRADEARSELAKLRADLAAAQQRSETAERERDETRAQLAQAATLTPRRCVTCAQEAAREMRSECRLIVMGWRESDWPEGFDKVTASIVCEDRAQRINALPLPSCDDCNPLKPEATR